MNRIRKLREERGWTQAVLGEHMGVRQATVSLWETGAVIPRKAMAKQLARILKVKVEQLELEPPKRTPTAS